MMKTVYSLCSMELYARLGEKIGQTLQKHRKAVKIK